MFLRSARGFSVTLCLLLLLSLPHPSFQGRIKGRWNKGGKSCILRAPPLCSCMVMFVVFSHLWASKSAYIVTHVLKNLSRERPWFSGARNDFCLLCDLGNFLSLCIGCWKLTARVKCILDKLLFLHPVSSAPVLSCPILSANTILVSLSLSIKSKGRSKGHTTVFVWKIRGDANRPMGEATILCLTVVIFGLKLLLTMHVKRC